MQLDSAYMAANAEGRLRMMALRTPLLLGRHAVENDTDIQRPPPDRARGAQTAPTATTRGLRRSASANWHGSSPGSRAAKRGQ